MDGLEKEKAEKEKRQSETEQAKLKFQVNSIAQELRLNHVFPAIRFLAMWMASSMALKRLWGLATPFPAMS